MHVISKHIFFCSYQLEGGNSDMSERNPWERWHCIEHQIGRDVYLALLFYHHKCPYCSQCTLLECFNPKILISRGKKNKIVKIKKKIKFVGKKFKKKCWASSENLGQSSVGKQLLLLLFFVGGREEEGVIIVRISYVTGWAVL